MKKKEVNLAEIEAPEQEQTCTTGHFEASVDTSFFYTSDRQLNAFDDVEIIQKIVDKFPNFVQKNKDTLLKKTLLIALDDNDFILDLLDYYQISIMDLIRIIYKQYSSLFNQLFIKKIREKIICKHYEKYKSTN